MVQPSEKICRVCGSPNVADANYCSHCGAALSQLSEQESKIKRPPAGYRSDFGETDLVERELNWRGGGFVVSGVIILLMMMFVGVLWLSTDSFPAGSFGGGMDNDITQTSSTDSQSNQAPIDTIFFTNTPRPTIYLSTVTPAPPTATATPTEGPCAVEVRANDTLIGIISRCGHRDLDVMDEVLELNNMSDAGALSLGQIIEVPRPTATVDPNAATEEPSDGETDSEANADGFTSLIFAEGAEGLPTFTPTPSPTLPPGIQWHVIQPDENIITVAYKYGANVEILSRINPEITFSQCDFGKDTGGPDCTVILVVGQQIRVPAPTPTPTLQPTASGSETPTPTATPTFNAPHIVSPGNRMLFRANELVTLRWSGTGTLAPDDTYRVRVTDLITGSEHTYDTRDTFYILPEDIQATDGQRHDYEWQVTVLNLMDSNRPVYVTGTRIFTWEGLGTANNEDSN